MINTTELQAALRELQGERAISFEMLLEALEAALISAYKRNFGGEANAIVTIDRDTGDFKVYHRRVVVEAVEDPKLEISTQDAGSRYEVGDFLDEEVTPRTSAASPRRRQNRSSCSASARRNATWSLTSTTASCTTS
jgi:N utilization substance protein A